MKLARCLQLYVFPAMMVLGLVAGVVLHHHALMILGALGTGFYGGVHGILFYVKQNGLVDAQGWKRHHDYLHHDGPPPTR